MILGEKQNEEHWYRCPRRPVKDDPGLFAEISQYYVMREKGFLPWPGSYMEQPNVFVQAMAVADAAVAECERFRDKKEALKRGEA